MKQITIYTDGASRGNPGTAASSWLILEGTNVLESDARALGINTNNTAEYTSLVYALNSANKFCIPAETEIMIISDSQLMIRQLQGEYRVNAPNLKSLFKTIKELCKKYQKVSFIHVTRDNPYISACDWLCNQMLDKQPRKKPVSEYDELKHTPSKNPKISQEKIVSDSSEPKGFELYPVGIIHSNIKSIENFPQYPLKSPRISTISIFPEYVAELGGLNAGDSVFILCWYPKEQQNNLAILSQNDIFRNNKGIFTTRTHQRANHILLCQVKIISISKREITVSGFDAIDNIPILDIQIGSQEFNSLK